MTKVRFWYQDDCGMEVEIITPLPEGTRTNTTGLPHEDIGIGTFGKKLSPRCPICGQLTKLIGILPDHRL